MNMTEEITENVENGEEVEVKRGRGRPKIPDELKKTKPKVHSGLPRGRPRIHPVKSRLTKTMKKPKILEINIGDKAQISLIKDFTNDDMLDTLPVKFVTKPHDVRGRPVKNTISQQIELVVIKPNNGKRGHPRNHVSHDESDSSDDESHTPSRGQSSPSKGRGRPRKSPYDKTNNNSEIYNKPSTSKGRGRPRKTPMKSVQSAFRGISRTPHISYTEYNESDYSDDEGYNHNKSPSKRQSQSSTSKGRGRPRKSPRIDIDDLEVMPSTLSRGRPRTKEEIDDDSNSVSSSETKSKGRGRPRKHTKNTILSSSSLISSQSKGRGRPRKYPMTSVSDTDSGVNDSPSTSKGRGRPRKYPKIDTPIDADKPKKGRGRPKKLSKPMKAMILTVDGEDVAIEHVLNDDQEGISKQKPGRGRPRKEAKVIQDTSDNGEGNTEFESQNSSGEIHLAESGVQDENQTTDKSSNCEDIEYRIGLNDEQTEIPLEDINAEPVSEIIS